MGLGGNQSLNCGTALAINGKETFLKKIATHPRFNRIYDFYHIYPSNLCPAVCHVRLIQDPGKRPVIICSEVAGNTGASVTNAAYDLVISLTERLLEQKMLRRPDLQALWVEHYNDVIVYETTIEVGGKAKDPNRYSLIYLNRETPRVSWRSTTLAALTGMAGYALNDFLVPENRLVLPLSESGFPSEVLER